MPRFPRIPAYLLLAIVAVAGFLLGRASVDRPELRTAAHSGDAPGHGRLTAGGQDDRGGTPDPLPGDPEAEGEETVAGDPDDPGLPAPGSSENLQRFLAGTRDRQTMYRARAEAGRLDPDEASAIFRQILALPERSYAVEALLPSLLASTAKAYPEFALEQAMNLPFPAYRQASIQNVFRTWASENPRAAFDRLRATDGNLLKSEVHGAYHAVISRVARDDLGLALDFVRTLPEDQDPQSGTNRNRLYQSAFGAAVHSEQREEIVDAMQDMEDEGVRSQALQLLVHATFDVDPREAVNLVSTLARTETEASAAQQSLVSRWAYHDPASAAAYVVDNLEGDAFRNSLQTAMHRWSQYDLEGAAAFLNGIPADESTDRAVQVIAMRAAQDDPPTAMSWAGSIFDEQTRRQSMTQVASQWIRQDPEGLRSFLDQAGLDPETEKHLRSMLGPPDNAGPPESR